MGTKRRRRTRCRYEDVPVGFQHYLAYGDFDQACLADPETGWVRLFLFAVDHGFDQRRTVWRAVRDRIVAEWVKGHPATRPFGWWEHDAPRWQRADLPPPIADMTDEVLERCAEPRRQVSGPRPLYEVSDTWPELSHGCPLEFDRPVDPADLPRFEAQASYLDRHGLLSGDERSRLPADAFEIETVFVDDDEIDEGDPDTPGSM